jgi:hypothetical protein
MVLKSISMSPEPQFSQVSKDLVTSAYDGAVLAAATMQFLEILQQQNHPMYEEFAAEGKILDVKGVGSEQSSKDKALLLRAYNGGDQRVRAAALETFAQVPYVVDILGINLNEDDEDELPPL